MNQVNLKQMEFQDIEKSEHFFGYAGFWKRLFAFVIDWFLIGLMIAALGILISGSLELTNMVTESEGLLELAGFIVPWLYYAGMESSEHQATLGKLALNIRVTDMAGQRIGFLRATVRHFSKILSSMLFLIGYIMIAFTTRKQGLHDIIAACLVINRV